MGTKLSKNIQRETDIEVNDKELIITLYSDGEIGIKPKGTRGKEKKIGILDLWEHLSESSPKESKKKKNSSDEPMISLYDLRHHSAISGLGPQLTAKFDGILKSLIDEWYRN
jgi:hypothetical protein